MALTVLKLTLSQALDQAWRCPPSCIHQHSASRGQASLKSRDTHLNQHFLFLEDPWGRGRSPG